MPDIRQTHLNGTLIEYPVYVRKLGSILLRKVIRTNHSQNLT